MKYAIETRTDLSGMMLALRFPENELDEKALYTIQYDMPDFLVPFRYHAVDGEIELTYCIGNRSKLRYFNGPKSPEEYVKMWEALLQPLLDCGDWFMQAFSFVMDSEYLFYDKQSERICYLYVPAKEDCSNYEELRTMVSKLASANSVSDSRLENVVLRKLVEDFQPKQFLDALREQISQSVVPQAHSGKGGGGGKVEPAPAPKPEPEPTPDPVPAPAPVPRPTPPTGDGGEIFINLSGGKKNAKSDAKKQKQDKPAKRPKFGLFGGGKDKERPMAVAAEPDDRRDDPAPPAPPAPQPAPPVPPVPVQRPDETQLMDYGTGLRLVGASGLPEHIGVEIEVGGVFSIGRHDKNLKQAQSSFEFPSQTAAVSRRHAVIERDEDGYTITDLSSRAGTFVNGTHLSANIPYRLRQGEKVSFGTSGADYIWEE